MFAKLFGKNNKPEEKKDIKIQTGHCVSYMNRAKPISNVVANTKAKAHNTLSFPEIEDNTQLPSKKSNWIEMPSSLMEQYGLDPILSDDIPSVSGEKIEKRLYRRMLTEHFVINENQTINVFCRNLSNNKMRTDVLLNISCWGLLLLSYPDKDKDIWTELELEFKIWKEAIKVRWVIVNQLPTSNKTKIKYWIQFINLKEEDRLHIGRIWGSVILGNDLYNK